MSVSRYEPSVLSDSEDGAVDQSYDAAKVFEQQHSGDWKLVCDVSGTRDGRKQVESSIRMGMEALQPQLWLSSLVTFLSAVFLPEGYPSSVSDDYAAYQVWDTLQAFCSSIMGTLSTHAVLKVYCFRIQNSLSMQHLFDFEISGYHDQDHISCISCKFCFLIGFICVILHKHEDWLFCLLCKLVLLT
eukprot:m.187398 g.187398  ORF g.187398 m.187398 type:complete len:187 (+) comp14773_c0_seq21:108-668(+)